MTAQSRTKSFNRKFKLSKRKAALSLKVAEFVDQRADFKGYLNLSDSSKEDLIETYRKDLQSAGIISWWSWWFVKSFIIPLLMELLFEEST